MEEFKLLGPLEVRVDGGALRLGGSKQRALLAVLLLHANEVVSSDRLVAELWPDKPPANAAHNLQVYVSRLRKLLPRSGLIVTRPPGYLLTVGPGELDLHRFEALLENARLAEDPAVVRARLGDALALWRGPPLADLGLERSAVLLEEIRLAALEERIDADLALGRHAGLVGELESLVAEHRLRERLHEQLMLALYRSGRQAEALEAYQDLRRALVDELGIEPGQPLQRLQQAILRQDASLEPPATLAPAQPLPAPTPADTGESREERKLVTVLFADLVDFTGRSDRADPEDVRAALRPYHARAKEEIERFGGTIEKFVGDAVMAVFGAPVAHEDDAERAVKAALAVVAAVDELGLPARVAVETGEAIVDLSARPETGESIVAGDVVSTAFRLQEAAPAGEVVIGALTHLLTEGLFQVDELPEATLKGKAEPVPVWRVVAPVEPAAEVEPQAATPFIGREDELALIEQTYRRTLRDGGIQLVTVVGEPGVGKSRLLREFRALLEARGEPRAWLQGRCLAYGEGITFWALGDVVKSRAGILESDGPDQALAKLDAAVAAVVGDPPEGDWIRSKLAPLVGLEPPEGVWATERQESFAAWTRFLEAIAAEGPLVLAVEDLHWADAALLEYLEHLIGWASDVSLVLACTARPELYEAAPAWGGGKRNSTTISLSALNDEQTARLIAALLSQTVLPADLQTTLQARSGGNPLYAEEFARMLTDRGLVDERGRLETDAEIPVPETIHALIAARLDTLPPNRKALLHDAAVVGRVFWAGAVAAMEGIHESTAAEGLRELAERELVRRNRSSTVRDETEFSFWHALVRDVAYGQIPRAERSRKHRAAAAWIERLAEGRVRDHAELLAHHSLQAVELARAAGANGELPALEAEALRFLALAGDRALLLDAAKADSYYTRALALAHPDAPGYGRLLAGAARAAYLAGRVPEADRRYEEALAALRAEGDVLGAGAAAAGYSRLLWLRRGTARAREVLQEAVQMLERLPPGPELALAYTQWASVENLAGRGAEALEWAERALPLARDFGLDEQLVRALQYRGYARYDLGDVGGLDDLRGALEIALERGLGYGAVISYMNLSDWVWLDGGPAAGLELLRTGIELGRQRGLGQGESVMWSRAQTLWHLYDLGEWDELVHEADELVAWDRARDGSQVGVIALTYKAYALVSRGEVAAAALLEDEFLPRARAIEDPQILQPSLAVSALIAKLRGDMERALSLVDELRRRMIPTYSLRALHLTDAVRIAVAAGSLELAERLLAGVPELLTRDRNSLVAARAALAEARGRLEDGAALYTEAAERWTDFGLAVEQAYALLGLGRCLGAHGRRDDAAPRVQEAREIFARLGALPLVAETDEWLRSAAAVSGS